MASPQDERNYSSGFAAVSASTTKPIWSTGRPASDFSELKAAGAFGSMTFSAGAGEGDDTTKPTTNSILAKMPTTQLVAPRRLARPARDVWSLLPPEIRNEVYDLVLPKSESSVDIVHRLPPITRVNKQTRTESMPVYFNITDLHTFVLHRNIATVISWLELFGGFDARTKQTARPLQIICQGRLLNRCEFWPCQHESAMRMRYCPDFPLWNSLVAAAKDAGMTSQQLRIETDFKTGFNNIVNMMSRPLGYFAFASSLAVYIRGAAIEPYLFTRFVLPSLLRMHGLYDDDAPPEDILDTVRNNTKLKDADDLAELHAMTRLDAMTLYAARESFAPPEFWFEHWATKLDVTEEMRIRIENECLRTMALRLLAQRKGEATGHLGLTRYRDIAFADLGINATKGEDTCILCMAKRKSSEAGAARREARAARRAANFSWHRRTAGFSAPDDEDVLDDDSEDDEAEYE